MYICYEKDGIIIFPYRPTKGKIVVKKCFDSGTFAEEKVTGLLDIMSSVSSDDIASSEFVSMTSYAKLV